MRKKNGAALASSRFPVVTLMRMVGYARRSVVGDTIFSARANPGDR